MAPSENPDVFVSYASEDRVFVREFVQWLEDAGLNIWFAEEDMRASADIEDELIESVDKCRHTVFVVSEHWLESDWTKFERSVAMEDCPEERRILVVARMEVSKPARTLGKDLYKKKFVSWREDEAEPDARFWEVYCGLGLDELGKQKDWAENGRRARGASSSKGEAVAESGGGRAAAAPIQVVPAAAQDALKCDRDAQWGELHTLTTDTRTHTAILVPGPAREGHEAFLKRVVLCLPRPDPRICEISWSGGCPPQSRAMANEAIARAIDCSPDRLEQGLQSILAERNLVLVHKRAFEETDCGPMIRYYREWLPDLVSRVVPGDAELPGRLKFVHAIRWPRVSAIECGLSRLFPKRKCEKVEAAKALAKELDKTTGALRVEFLDELQPITPEDVESWGRSLNLGPDSPLIQHALDGVDSADILKRIEERLDP